MDIVIVGHVDHGKSTVVGRLLVDTNSLPDGKLEQVKRNCERKSQPFEYAFLLDALMDEQSQGITIDAARIFFKTQKRSYTVIDAPGHIEFLKNMVTGASRASAAILVIDAKEGVQENSRRHGYILSMLGVKQIAVVVNKMDLLAYSELAFTNIRDEYSSFLSDINIKPICFIPVVGLSGDNITTKSERMPWYSGQTIIDTLDSFSSDHDLAEKPFRMPVQDVYKFTKGGDDRRIVAGSIETGRVSIGDEVVFYPSGKKSVVKGIETFNAPIRSQMSARSAIGFTLKEQIYVSRGELATLAKEAKPKIATRIKASLFWLGKSPMSKKKNYFLKLGTAKVEIKLMDILRVIDSSNLSTLSGAEEIVTNSVAECVLQLERPIAFDLATDCPSTSRFVILDGYDISGGGLAREALEDEASGLREKVILRNTKWEQGTITFEDRAERYNQKACLVLVTSEKKEERKILAKKVEAELFANGRVVYYLGMATALYSVGADLKDKGGSRDEALRRFSEIVNILLDAGMIVIGTVSGLTQSNLETIKTTIDSRRIETVWVGESVSTDVVCDLATGSDSEDEAVHKIKARLQERGYIFNPR